MCTVFEETKSEGRSEGRIEGRLEGMAEQTITNYAYIKIKNTTKYYKNKI